MTISETMKAYLLTGFGGSENLSYREDIPVPAPDADEVLIKVEACGINNTDIWTRLGAYGGSVDDSNQSGWRGGAFHFPRIQGADIVGCVVALGDGVNKEILGKRVMVNPTLYEGKGPLALLNAGLIGSERDGGFAEYVALPATTAIPITSPLSSAELATFMVSYLTAEHMLNRADVRAGDHILITGASGGVGSALLQLAKYRYARASCVIGRGKEDFALSLGADAVYTREDTIDIKNESIDVIADVVGGQQAAALLDSLKFGGRFVIAGAIAGPEAKIDWRKVYLKHLTLLGSTMGTPQEAQDLAGYIETGAIKPVLHARYALKELIRAQEAFLEKRFLGKLVITP